LFSVGILSYLTGNPCVGFKFYRLYVVGTLPQLESLDGVPVLHTERLAAKANFDYIQSKILEQESKSKKKNKRKWWT
jgi:protein TilB